MYEKSDGFWQDQLHYQERNAGDVATNTKSEQCQTVLAKKIQEVNAGDVVTNTKSEQCQTVFTKKMIEKRLNKCAKSWKNTGLFFMGVAVFNIRAVLGTISNEDFAGTIFLFLLGIGATYIGIKSICQWTKDKKNISKGLYKIVQSTCVSVTKEEYDEDLVSYDIKFSNGESYSRDYVPGGEGDIFYLVYLTDSKKAEFFLKGSEYTPSPDLVIEKQ